MRMSWGNGGWVAVDGLELPGPLYVRFREGDGRLRISEIYLDASGSLGGITLSDLRDVPLQVLETFVNAEPEHVRAYMDEAAPDLSTLASYFNTLFGEERQWIDEGNWVAASFAAQRLPAGTNADTTEAGTRVARVRRRQGRWKRIREVDSGFRLTGGPSEGLTDGFLHDVARAYSAAVARGERPNVAIAEQTGHPLKSVQRWVYTARQRRIMPPGRKGRVG